MARDFPLTARPPAPHKFGFSILKVEDSLVRICGERGSHCVFLLALLFEVSAIALAAPAALTTGVADTWTK